MSRPTQISKRGLRCGQLDAHLFGPGRDVATYAELREHPAVAGWAAAEVYLALLDLRDAGRVRLVPVGTGADLRIVRLGEREDGGS